MCSALCPVSSGLQRTTGSYATFLIMLVVTYFDHLVTFRCLSWPPRLLMTISVILVLALCSACGLSVCRLLRCAGFHFHYVLMARLVLSAVPCFFRAPAHHRLIFDVSYYAGLGHLCLPPLRPVAVCFAAGVHVSCCSILARLSAPTSLCCGVLCVWRSRLVLFVFGPAFSASASSCGGVL